MTAGFPPLANTSRIQCSLSHHQDKQAPGLVNSPVYSVFFRVSQSSPSRGLMQMSRHASTTRAASSGPSKEPLSPVGLRGGKRLHWWRTAGQPANLAAAQLPFPIGSGPWSGKTFMCSGVSTSLWLQPPLWKSLLSAGTAIEMVCWVMGHGGVWGGI